MKIYPDEFDFKDPKERELAHEQRLQQLKEQANYIKRRNKSYLKGQYGKRLYYDKTKCDDLDDELDDNDEDEIKRPVKCVFTKNLRRDKLFHYLKYLNGKKVLIRDLAWKFAVTERTIQNDLRWLENNGFVERKINKNAKGKMTKNSFVVRNAKEVDLPCKDNFLRVVFVAKQNESWYILTKTDYKTSKGKTINECSFTLPNQKQRYAEKLLNENSFAIAKQIFQQDLRNFYKGHIFTDLYKHYSYKYFRFGGKEATLTKYKNYFTLFELPECLPTAKNYYWLKLSVAPRRIKDKSTNKCLKQLKNLL